MSMWRESPTVALTLTALFLVIQLGIPASRLGEKDARRFGWQMFATLNHQPEFTVHTENSSEPVDLADVLVRVRDDLALVNSVPAHLCATFPDAEKITWEGGEYRC